MGTPLLIHQPSYSMLNRWIEEELLDALEDVGSGCIAFSPLAQGVLTDQYLDGDPGGLARRPGELPQRADLLTDETLAHVRALNDDRLARGQSLAQMALAWALRDPRVTSAGDRRQQRRSSSRTTSARCDIASSAAMSSRGSTSTRRSRHQHLG